jgi:hypothetical protein
MTIDSTNPSRSALRALPKGSDTYPLIHTQHKGRPLVQGSSIALTIQPVDGPIDRFGYVGTAHGAPPRRGVRAQASDLGRSPLGGLGTDPKVQPYTGPAAHVFEEGATTIDWLVLVPTESAERSWIIGGQSCLSLVLSAVNGAAVLFHASTDKPRAPFDTVPANDRRLAVFGIWLPGVRTYAAAPPRSYGSSWPSFLHRSGICTLPTAGCRGLRACP